MKFDTTIEDKKFQQLVEGEADYEVIGAQDAVSKKGNDMIKLTIKCWDSSGNNANVFDYLLPQLSWKIKQFLDSGRKPELFERGDLEAQECVGQAGRCILALEKDSTGQYPDQIKIKDYLPAIATPSDDTVVDEDLPF